MRSSVVGMRLLLALIALCAVAPAASAESVLGIDYRPRAAGLLRPLDPVTLRPQGAPIARWGGFHWGTAFSGDGRRLAISNGKRGRLTVIDLRSGAARTIANTRMPLAWLQWVGGSILGVTCCEAAGHAVEVHPSTGQRARSALGGEVMDVATTSRGPVALLAPKLAVGEARIAVLSPGLAPRFIAVPGVRAGSAAASQDPRDAFPRSFRPAVASDGRTAWVISSEALRVVAVDLATGAAVAHDLAPPAARAAKGGESHFRFARFLGDGRIAFAGDDEAVDGRITPIGVWHVDTTSWTARRLDPGAREIHWNGAQLLTVDYAADELQAYRGDGSRLWRRRSKTSGIVVAGRHGYVRNGARRGRDHRTQVIDLRSGRVERTLRTTRLPQLLVP